MEAASGFTSEEKGTKRGERQMTCSLFLQQVLRVFTVLVVLLSSPSPPVRIWILM